MLSLEGKSAFITGGANGIGFAMAEAFVQQGMHVVITDIDAAALEQAAAALRGSNTQIITKTLDVTDRDAYRLIADEVEQEIGPIHVLCNNAGVYRGGSLDAVTYADWDWVMGVNVGGVVNGIQTWVQRMKAHGEGGHIVNTASMAGLTTSPGLGVYNASKFAVVGLSEALRQDLEEANIGVSVLCPGMVKTQILDSERTRPVAFDSLDEEAETAARAHSEIMHLAMNTGIEASEVAACVVAGIKANALYLLPHPELKDPTAERTQHILDAFGEPDPERVAAQQQFLADLLPE